MAANRSLKDLVAYKKYLRELTPADGCAFCQIGPGHEQFVAQTTYFKVIRNRFPYAEWDGLPVVEHLMLIPKDHTESLTDLTPEQRIEYVELIGQYEAQSYSSYTRHKGSSERSITHLHTHLLKLDHSVSRTQQDLFDRSDSRIRSVIRLVRR